MVLTERDIGGDWCSGSDERALVYDSEIMSPSCSGRCSPTQRQKEVISCIRHLT